MFTRRDLYTALSIVIVTAVILVGVKLLQTTQFSLPQASETNQSVLPWSKYSNEKDEPGQLRDGPTALLRIPQGLYMASGSFDQWAYITCNQAICWISDQNSNVLNLDHKYRTNSNTAVDLSRAGGVDDDDFTWAGIPWGTAPGFRGTSDYYGNLSNDHLYPWSRDGITAAWEYPDANAFQICNHDVCWILHYYPTGEDPVWDLGRAFTLSSVWAEGNYAITPATWSDGNQGVNGANKQPQTPWDFGGPTAGYTTEIDGHWVTHICNYTVCWRWDNTNDPTNNLPNWLDEGQPVKIGTYWAGKGITKLQDLYPWTGENAMSVAWDNPVTNVVAACNGIHCWALNGESTAVLSISSRTPWTAMSEFVPTPIPTSTPTPIPPSSETPLLHFAFDECEDRIANNIGRSSVIAQSDGLVINKSTSSGQGQYGTCDTPADEYSAWAPGLIGDGSLKTGGSQTTFLFSRIDLSKHINSDITISAWIKADGSEFEPNTGIVTEEYKSDDVTFGIFGNNTAISGTSNKKINIGFYSSKWEGVSQSGELTFGDWVHVVGTYDGSTIKLYLNGELDTSAEIGLELPRGNDSWIVGKRWDTNVFFNGALDDFRLYNETLTADQVAQLYAEGQDEEPEPIPTAPLPCTITGQEPADEATITLPNEFSVVADCPSDTSFTLEFYTINPTTQLPDTEAIQTYALTDNQYTVPADDLAPGNYVWKVDANNDRDSSDFYTVTIAEEESIADDLPDLTVSQLIRTENDDATEYGYRATIQNVASVPVPQTEFITHLYVDPDNVPPLATDPETEVNGWALGLAAAGSDSDQYDWEESGYTDPSATVCVFVDVNNTIAESDETNNVTCYEPEEPEQPDETPTPDYANFTINGATDKIVFTTAEPMMLAVTFGAEDTSTIIDGNIRFNIIDPQTEEVLYTRLDTSEDLDIDNIDSAIASVFPEPPEQYGTGQGTALTAITPGYYWASADFEDDAGTVVLTSDQLEFTLVDKNEPQANLKLYDVATSSASIEIGQPTDILAFFDNLALQFTDRDNLSPSEYASGEFTIDLFINQPVVPPANAIPNATTTYPSLDLAGDEGIGQSYTFEDVIFTQEENLVCVWLNRGRTIEEAVEEAAYNDNRHCIIVNAIPGPDQPPVYSTDLRDYLVDYTIQPTTQPVNFIRMISEHVLTWLPTL